MIEYNTNRRNSRTCKTCEKATRNSMDYCNQKCIDEAVKKFEDGKN